MKVLLVGEGASELAGALQTLVRRIGLDDVEIDQDKVSQQKIHAHHGKGKGLFKRTVRWMIEAEERGYDGLILVIDEDGDSTRSKQIAEAQDYQRIPLRRALGVAILTFDAWMLADEKALTSILDCPVSRQPDPEKISNPKQTCSQLLSQSEVDLVASALYAQLAAIIDIDILEKRCKKGFAPFAARVRAM